MHSNCRTSLPILLLHNLDPGWPADDLATALDEVAALEAALGEAGHSVTPVAVQDADLDRCLRDYHPDEFVVFNGCEELPGMPRSEALVAQELETLGFAYTGSPAAVLALSWDKANVSRLLDRHELPTPHWRVCGSAQPEGWDCFPAIVKPAYEHCSLGVTTGAVVLTPSELGRRIAYVLEEFHQPALVQDFVDGREFHVSVWGNGIVRMLPPAEMDFTAFEDRCEWLCTFDSKFRPGSPHYEKIAVRVPALLDAEEYSRLEETALEVYRVFGCRDYARLDLRLRDGTFYVLDVNPNPDLSPETSLAQAARVAGYSYGMMASYLVHLATQRHPRLSKRRH